jgi:hypothetical protein
MAPLEHKAAVKLQTAYRQWNRRTEEDPQARVALRRVRQLPAVVAQTKAARKRRETSNV